MGAGKGREGLGMALAPVLGRSAAPVRPADDTTGFWQILGVLELVTTITIYQLT